jgi:hypothetical protein
MLAPDVAQAVYTALYLPGSTLSLNDAAALFLAGDGFGRIPNVAAWKASGIGWDWSHLRDSTPEGVARITQTARGLGLL